MSFRIASGGTGAAPNLVQLGINNPSVCHSLSRICSLRPSTGHRFARGNDKFKTSDWKVQSSCSTLFFCHSEVYSESRLYGAVRIVKAPVHEVRPLLAKKNLFAIEIQLNPTLGSRARIVCYTEAAALKNKLTACSTSDPRIAHRATNYIQLH